VAPLSLFLAVLVVEFTPKPLMLELILPEKSGKN
jgi:hypothetical protein